MSLIALGASARAIKNYAVAHKIISSVVLVVLILGGWWGYGKVTGVNAQTHYVLGTVERGTVVAAISGSGQVSASSQVDLSPKAGGQLVVLTAHVGQAVKAGDILAQTDAADAAYDLETAQISYQKIITDYPTNLRDAQNAATTAQTSLADAYAQAHASLTKAASDMTDVVNGLNDLFGGYLGGTKTNTLDNVAREYATRAATSEGSAKSDLNDLIKNFHTVSAQSSPAELDAMLSQFASVASHVAEAAKFGQDAVVYIRDRDTGNKTLADAAFASITALVAQANANVSSLAATQSTIVSDTQAVQKTQTDLADLGSGPDSLSLHTGELAVRQKRTALEDHVVRAPFDGIIASVAAKKGDTLGSGTTVATIITAQKIAEISLNEVDAAKVAVGQKATLTFDAIDGLELTGKVAEVGLVGTVTQGVVSYSVKIALDSDDPRIKPGMTANATIQTAVSQNVLVVPSSAVKTQNGSSYVQAFDPPLSDLGTSAGVTAGSPPVQIPVQLGISDDAHVEIVSGLSEGEQIVTRTVSGTASAAAATRTTTTPQRFGTPGAGIRL